MTPSTVRAPRAIAFDLSTVRTGIAHGPLDGQAETRSAIPTAGPDDPSRRLHQVTDEALFWIRKEEPDVALLEDLVLAGHRQAMARLAEVAGAVKVALFQEGVPYVVVAPSRLKKWATGSGKAEKGLLLERARSAGATPSNHDEADAWWLWDLARAHYGPGDLVTSPEGERTEVEKARLEVLAAIAWPQITVR